MTATQEKKAEHTPTGVKCKGTHVHFFDTAGVQHEAIIGRFLGNPVMRPAANVIIMGGDGPLQLTSVPYKPAYGHEPLSWHHPNDIHEAGGSHDKFGGNTITENSPEV